MNPFLWNKPRKPASTITFLRRPLLLTMSKNGYFLVVSHSYIVQSQHVIIISKYSLMIIEYYNLCLYNVCFFPLTVNNHQWTSSFFDEQRLFCHGTLDHTSNRYSNISQGLNPNTTYFNKIYWFSNISFFQCHYVRLRHADCWCVVWQGNCILTTISGTS